MWSLCTARENSQAYLYLTTHPTKGGTTAPSSQPTGSREWKCAKGFTQRDMNHVKTVTSVPAIVSGEFHQSVTTSVVLTIKCNVYNPFIPPLLSCRGQEPIPAVDSDSTVENVRTILNLIATQASLSSLCHRRLSQNKPRGQTSQVLFTCHPKTTGFQRSLFNIPQARNERC